MGAQGILLEASGFRLNCPVSSTCDRSGDLSRDLSNARSPIDRSSSS